MKDQLQPVSKVLQRGDKTAESQAWLRVETFTDPDGNTVQTTNIAYMELASGMHYREDGEWRESQAVIESYPTGAIARHGNHKVIFADNLASDVVVDLEMPDGRRLQSRVLGLFYYDSESGKSALIAEARESTGRITESNRVVYADAFAGLNADVRYTYKKSGLEQDIILREQPKTPETYGMNPATTRLQAITEFLSPPTPEQRPLKTKTFEDVTLDFGSMRMILGKTFTVDAENNPAKKVPVGKRWETINGRTILIEEVPLSRIQKQLSTLPEHRRTSSFWKRDKNRNIATRVLKLPERKTVASVPRAMQMASITAPSHGLVLDYVIVGSSVTDYTFKGDTTYLITDEIYAWGLTTVEGGTVIKYSSYYLSSIRADGFDFKTAPYRQAIFTSVNDNTVGEAIGSGSPTTGSQLYLYSVGGVPLRYSNVRYAGYGTYDDDHSDIWHSQFVNCGIGVLSLKPSLYNVLFNGCSIAVYDTYGWGGDPRHIEHVTANNCGWFWYGGSASNPHLVNNSIFVSVTTLFDAGITPSFLPYEVNISSSSGVFRTGTGAGNHYLIDSTLHKDVGTPSINSTLFEDLKTKTVFGPPNANILDNATIANNTTWSPTVQRDDDNQPDLGYHYDPLDYCVSRATLAGTLNVQSGTAIAFYGTYGFQYGTLKIDGTPLNRSKIAHYSAVQEQSSAWGANASASYLLKNASMPTTTATFTDISTAGGPKFGGDWVNTLNLSHSSLYGAKMNIYGGIPVTQAFTNNILQRSTLEYGRCGGADYQMRFVNNLFLDSKLSVGEFCNVSLISGLTVRNNLFAKSTFTRGTSSGYSPTVTHNGYHSSTVTSQGSSPKTINSLDFASGPLGHFYFQTGGGLSQLIDAGYTTSATLGLCPYTVQENLAPESSSTSDIGYHYAVSTPTATSTTDTTCKNTPKTITLTGAGSSCGALVFVIVVLPAHGTLGTIFQVNDTTATVVYTPVSTYCGTDQFKFLVKDNGIPSEPATVDLTVGNPNPTANCADVLTPKNTAITFTLTGTGSCNDSTTFTKVSDPINGTITAFNPNTGSVTYQPMNGFEGTDTFTFKITSCGIDSSDATVTIQVVPAPALIAECHPSRIILTWTLPPFLEQLAALGYIQDFQIFRCNTSSGNCTPSTSATPLTEISDPLITRNPQLWKFVDSTVSSGQTYCYAIRFRHQNSCAVTPPLVSPISAPVCATICCPSSAQYWVDPGTTATQLAEWLSKPGDTVMNATLSGSSLAKGRFGGGLSVGLPSGFDNGVILSTGDIELSKGPNNSPGAGLNLGITTGDPLLDQLLDSIESLTAPELLDNQDPSVLEFDLMAKQQIFCKLIFHLRGSGGISSSC